MLRPRALSPNAARYKETSAASLIVHENQASRFIRGKTYAFDKIIYAKTEIILSDVPVVVPTGTSITITGWVIDWKTNAPPAQLTVRVDHGPAAPVLNDRLPRPDVAAALQNSAAANSGFEATIPPSQLPSGIHRIRLSLIGARKQIEVLPPIVVGVGPVLIY
jgi:hypothetical protein